MRGEPLDARTDLYSLSASAYWMLTGRNYFGELPKQPTALREAIPATPPHLPIPGVSEGLNGVLRRGLAKEPEARFPDADAMLAALGPPGRDVPVDIGGAPLRDTSVA